MKTWVNRETTSRKIHQYIWRLTWERPIIKKVKMDPMYKKSLYLEQTLAYRINWEINTPYAGDSITLMSWRTFLRPDIFCVLFDVVTYFLITNLWSAISTKLNCILWSRTSYKYYIDDTMFFQRRQIILFIPPTVQVYAHTDEAFAR